MRIINNCKECGIEFSRVSRGGLFSGNRIVESLCDEHQPEGGCVHPRLHKLVFGDIQCRECSFRWNGNDNDGWGPE
jgi:hypothetical protein